MEPSDNERKETPVNTWKTANAVSEQGYSLYVSLVDGRDFIVDALLDGDVRITPGVRTYEGGLQLLEDLDAELRVREDVGGWAW